MYTRPGDSDALPGLTRMPPFEPGSLFYSDELGSEPDAESGPGSPGSGGAAPGSEQSASRNSANDSEPGVAEPG